MTLLDLLILLLVAGICGALGQAISGFFVGSGEITYLGLHPNGAHAGEALRSRAEALTDEVINSANSTGGDKYEVEQRTHLLKLLSSLRAALAKTLAPEKNELLVKLQRVKSITAPR